MTNQIEAAVSEERARCIALCRAMESQAGDLAASPEEAEGIRGAAFNLRVAISSTYRASPATLTNEAAPAGEVIPAGMKPWHGGNSAPEDWDGGPVLMRDGDLFRPYGRGGLSWRHFGSDHPRDIIAYTPKAAPQTTPDVGALVEAHAALYPVTSEARQALLNLRAALNTVTNEGEGA